MRTLSDAGYAKVTEQHLIVLPEKHIFGLDVSMNHMFTVRILQGIRELPGKRHDRSQWELHTPTIALA